MLVDNTPFREAFKRSGLSCKALGRLAGLDDTVAGRALGIYPMRDNRRNGKCYFNKRMRYDTALKLMRALNADPVDLGI